MIRVGMLWFDDNPRRSLNTKIELAARHYQDKYGDCPNICYVHPSSMAQIVTIELPIRVLAAQDILPHHFLLGIAHAKSDLAD